MNKRNAAIIAARTLEDGTFISSPSGSPPSSSDQEEGEEGSEEGSEDSEEDVPLDQRKVARED